MHALVSTVRFLVLVDLTTGAVDVIEAHRPEYYGISWFPGSSDLVLSHSVVNNDKLTDIASYARSEVGYLSRGAEASPPFLSAPHQILCASDGRVVATNTGRNRIQAVNFERPGLLQEAGISEPRWDRLDIHNTIGDHLNSVFERDGQLYVVAHGHRKGSQLAVFSYPDMNLLRVDPIPNATGVHNVFVETDGSIIGCDSEANALIDMKTSIIRWQAGNAGYTRGLAASQDCLFIGESARAPRADRAYGHAGVWILDRHSYQTLDYLSLGCYGAVHEVRLIDVPDAAHHGTPLLGGRDALRQKTSPHPLDIPASNVCKTARLQAAQNRDRHSRYWRSFAPVLGQPAIDEEGWLQAPAEGGLFLAVLREPASGLGASYSLAPTEPSHLSLVANYRGNGTDSLMDAFLLRSFGHEAALQLWRHEGESWQIDERINVTGLPLEGRISMKVEAHTARVFLNDEEILSGAALQRHPEDGGQLGIRSIGAAFRPAA